MDINKTQLNPGQTMERGVYHRDQFAHYFRWTHLLKEIKIGQTVLDVGCGSGELCKVLYTNKRKPERYVGVDIRKDTIAKNNQMKTNFPTEFVYQNIITDPLPKGRWDFITFLEVLEHNERQYADQILQNIKSVMSAETVFFLSTPCFNGSKADNHVYEYTYPELKEILERHFKIEAVYGTFISKPDIEKVMTGAYKEVYEDAAKYHDNNVLAILLAYKYPETARNCLWRLRLKDEDKPAIAQPIFVSMPAKMTSNLPSIDSVLDTLL